MPNWVQASLLSGDGLIGDEFGDIAMNQFLYGDNPEKTKESRRRVTERSKFIEWYVSWLDIEFTKSDRFFVMLGRSIKNITKGGKSANGIEYPPYPLRLVRLTLELMASGTWPDWNKGKPISLYTVRWCSLESPIMYIERAKAILETKPPEWDVEGTRKWLELKKSIEE